MTARDLEDVGELLDFDVEFREGELADFALEFAGFALFDVGMERFAFPDEGGFVRALGAEGVAVDTVVTERLSLPPTNHLASGSCQSRTLVQDWNQWSSFAALAQKVSGSAIDWA